MNFASINVYWYILPLVIAISLVYAASRHESWPIILRHAFRLGLWIGGVYIASTAFLLVIDAFVID